MSIDDVISRMGKVRIRDRTTSTQRLVAAHHRDVNMIFETYTPSAHGTIDHFLQVCDVKNMKDQAFIMESAAFRRQYDEWEAKQNEKQVQTSARSTSHNKETSTPISTSVSTGAAASTSTSALASTSTTTVIKESTEVKQPLSTSTSTSTVTKTPPKAKDIHVRTVKYQRLYDIMGTDWDGLKKEWTQKCNEWNDASIHQRSLILNASVLNEMANKYKCTSGRWMFFLTSQHDVTGIWKRCVKACEEGVVGPHIEISRSSAQASTVTPAGENWKLGIWTWDYNDVHEFERVLKEIKKLIPNVNAKTCSYKSKISSFLEILSKNEWNLPYKMHEHLLSQPSSRRRY